MQGFCVPCGLHRPIVEWNNVTGRLECPSHIIEANGPNDDLTTAKVASPKTEVIDARTSQAEESGPDMSAWAEVDQMCTALGGVLDENDEAYTVKLWRRDNERLRSGMKTRLVHSEYCNYRKGKGPCDCSPTRI